MSSERNVNNASPRALCAVVLTLLSAAASTAEIRATQQPKKQTALPDGEFHLQCWQEGIKVVDESNLRAFSAASETYGQLLSFEQGAAGGKVILLTVGKSLCMAKR